MTGAWVGTRAETIQRAIGDARDELIITAPDAETLRAIGMVEGVRWPRNVRVLTTRARANELRRDFLTATRMATLVGDGTVALRTTPGETLPQPLLITSDDVTCLLALVDDDTAAVRTADDEVFHLVRGRYLSVWGDARSFELTGPAYSTILQTVGEEFDEPMRTDVETMLRSSLATRAFDVRLDEVHAVLLVAAKHRLQYYEVTRWAEEIGLGSAATFSNRKGRLEEAGLLATETLQTGTVGRPRQRLVLTDAALREASVQDLVTVAQSVLAE